MPTTWNGMTRVMVEGIPVWKNAGGDLFYYDPDLKEQTLKVGTLEGGFAANWKEVCAGALEAYREGLKIRPRALAPSARTKTTAAGQN